MASRSELTVVLHADVVGSTALVQKDERQAHDRIQDVFRRFSEIIVVYGGTTRELRGDALLAQFDRASDAISAALAFQAKNAAHNITYRGEIRPVIRIGISLGEVVIADGTLTGPDVVLAQRLEQLADPGGVCVSQAVSQSTPRRLPFDYENLGDQELKGFSEPILAHRVALRKGEKIPAPEPESPQVTVEAAVGRRMPRRILAAAVVILISAGGSLVWWKQHMPELQPAVVEGIANPRSDKPSIAVLPFNNLSQNPEQEYFSDGLSEDLITDLSRISGLRVIARHSSFSYKGQSGDVQRIGRELGARYVLEGSVRKSGEWLRINAQLIDAKDGTHLWAERYDRKLTDVFKLQDEVTQTIVSALAINLTSEEERFLERAKTANPDAYDALLRGLEPLHRFTRDDSAVARDYFSQAIALDPDFARAHANLALTHAQDVSFGWTDKQTESIRLALESIELAEALDDSIVQTHFARSTIDLVQKQYQNAETSIRRAIQINPNYADGYGQLAITQLYAGQLQESLSAIYKAKRLNPRYPFVYLWIEGHAHFLLGNHEKSIAIVKEVLDRNPTFEIARLTLIATYGHLGMEDEASWEIDELLTLRPGYSLSTARQEALHNRPEDLEKFIEGLRRAGIPG